MMPPEREFSIQEAKMRLSAILDQLGLQYRVLKSTEFVCYVGLFDQQGLLVAEGSGKGKYPQVGAIAEAIEHYHLEWSSYDETYLIRNDRLSAQSPAIRDGILQTLGTWDGETACWRMTEVAGQEGIDIPVPLLWPVHFAGSDRKAASEQFLQRYASNSGMAFGCSLEEARLHALNEIIERHCLSNLYLGLVGKREHYPLAHLSFDDAPSRDITARAANLFIGETPFATHFSIAVDSTQPNSKPTRLIGSGCSVIPSWANLRAMSELVQVRTLYNDDSRKIDQIVAARLASVSLHSLIELPIKSSKKYIGSEKSPLITVVDQVRLILGRLASSGYRAYERSITDYPGLGTVIQIYIPEMDRFHLIRAGNIVVPNEILMKSAT